MRHTNRLLLTLTILVLFVTLALGAYLLWDYNNRRLGGGGSSKPTKTGGGLTCPLDGEPATASVIERRPLAVMIENSPSARPQSGLDKACVVYEAITEGGITRFMAIYLHQDAAVVGPVRSARPHFIDLSRDYNAALTHCGESYEALQILTYDTSLINLDQMKYGKPFWRDSARRMPHNLYTSTEKLRKLMAQHGWGGAVGNLPQFANQQGAAGGDDAPAATITFGGAVNYKLRIAFNASKGGYLRYMDGKLHIDRETGRPIVARNVLVQYVMADPNPDSKLGTYDVQVTGSGFGELFVDGKRYHLRWNKSGVSSVTSFTDDSGKPLPFREGQTWVEVVPLNGNVVYGRAPSAPASP